MEEMHNFYYTNTFIDFLNIYYWTFLLLTARLLFKYFFCGGPSFVLAYLCMRYFWGLIIIFVKCNLDLEQNEPFTLHR